MKLENLAIFKEAFKEWVKDRAQSLASSLAYYELLSVGPVVAFVLFAAGKIAGPVHLHEDIIPLMKSVFTPQLIKVITLMLSVDHDLNAGNLVTISVGSAILLLWAGKEYFEQIKVIVDTSWNKRRYTFGIKAFIERALDAFKIACITVIIILSYTLVRALLPHPYVKSGIDSSIDLIFFKLTQWIFEILIIVTVRVFYFTYLSPLKINWRNTIPGALLGAVLFIIGKEIMHAHFSHRPDADSAESLVMVLLWFYYSGLTFIYSAEFTKLYVAKKQRIELKDLKFDQ